MKKITLLFLLFSLNNFGQIINIPDASFKAILLSSSTQNSIAQDLNYQSIQIDSNNDNEIQVSEVLQVVRLNLYTPSNYNLFIAIQNIQGIEYFVNLQQFIFGSASVSQADFSSNLYLKELILGFNTNLNSLNISNNPNLEKLNISNTSISALDITNCIGLKDLRFDNTLISSIDFSNCVLLNYVTCYDTQIVDLDFSNNIGIQISVFCD